MKHIIELAKEEIKGNRDIAYALLKSKTPFFVNTTLDLEEDNIVITSLVEEDYQSCEYVKTLIIEEKLRYLINLAEIYPALKDSKYTYRFDTNSIVFTKDGLPLLIYRGIVDQVPPYESITYEKFLKSYKAIIISFLDGKADYDKLVEGGLEFYKGNLFCEKIVKEETLEKIRDNLSDFYNKEKIKNNENYALISKRSINFLKTSIFITVLTTLILSFIVGYVMISTIPKKNAISDIRLSFINKDYSNVIKVSKNIDSKSISQDDKYIIAYSVIQSEPLTEKQKEQLSKINNQANADYLRYWVLLGQSKIEEAIDVASFLDDPQLLMYGITKKIDEIQRDPNLSSEKRTEQLNNYKTKLEELKKKYIVSEENSKK
ncbi:type VII secretion protein EssB [Gemella cuniculi]|uniref:type VII secretion protein EssB n=1 Tax=Gemella cuniculi TaxID=150240 RepID=UPI0004071DFB|nr:type VII secretion protein EssB [Gemella cuniculi]